MTDSERIDTLRELAELLVHKLARCELFAGRVRASRGAPEELRSEAREVGLEVEAAGRYLNAVFKPEVVFSEKELRERAKRKRRSGRGTAERREAHRR